MVEQVDTSVLKTDSYLWSEGSNPFPRIIAE